MSIHHFTINFKKKFPFYSENCKWLERKIQRGANTIHVARNVLINLLTTQTCRHSV